MHEFGLCEAIIDKTRSRADGRAVSRVTVRVGTRLRAEEDSMTMAFAMLTDGTELAGAALDLIQVPATATCRTCSASFDTAQSWDTCEACSGGDLDVTGGEELVLESVAYQPVNEGVP